MITRRVFLNGFAATLATQLSMHVQPATAQVVRVRRDVTRLPPDDPFFVKYALAINRMRDLQVNDSRSWRNQAIIHADHCSHSTNDFFQWHRFYLAYFERICGELIGDSSFALPYWNWSNNEGRLPAPFFENNSLNVEFLNDPSDYTSPQSARTPWGQISTVATNALSPTVGLQSNPLFSSIFTAQAISDIQHLTTFADFSGALEGSPHNVAHGLVGQPNGHMGYGLSPLDPVFWLHHCNVDRIWAEWQAAGNYTPPTPDEYDEQFVDEAGNSVRVSADDSHDHMGLGYTYDTLTSLFTGVRGTDDEIGNLLALEEALENLGDQTAILENNPVSLGIEDNTRNTAVGVTTDFVIQAPTIEQELFRQRLFRATEVLTRPRNAIESRRVLAILRGVSFEGADNPGIVGNLFVDCPYLSPLTESTDPHYAGGVAFFGPSMTGMGGARFVVDVTSALHHLAQQGRLRDEVRLQLIPVPLSPDTPQRGNFQVSSVELQST